MIKKICFYSILLFALMQCGNEESDFPGTNGAGVSNTPPVEYKIFTPVFYKAPYSSEMLYYLLQLANFNKINSSFFLFFNIDSPNYKTQMQNFLSTRTENINILTLGVVPKEIPLIEKFQSYVDKAIFLFPTEKPSFETAGTTTDSNKTSSQIFPVNYNYMANTIKLRYSLQDRTFLAAALKAMTGGNINIPPLSNINEIAYIQGETRPQTAIRVLQGETAESLKEKSSLKSLDDGSISGIPVDPSQSIQLALSYEKNSTTYWISNMNGSFLFFLFPFLPKDQMDIASYFTPLKIENLTFAGNHVKLSDDSKNKALYAIHIIVDPSADEKATSWEGEYRNGELSLKISPNFIPVSYNSKDLTMNMSGSSAIKFFTEVKETKKDYSARSVTGGALTLYLSDNSKTQQKEESSPTP